MPYAQFADRADAAAQLALALSGYQSKHPLVLAIPRGAVPIGRIVADALGAELDVVLVRKLGAPGNPELAIGAIDERGHVQLASHSRIAGVDDRYVRGEAQRQLDVIHARRRQYSPYRPPLDPRNRTVIVIDDGLATGATMSAALASVRAQGPARLICAVPVAARTSIETIAGLADEVVCLLAPDDFYAVGQFYRDFSEVDDAQVLRLLARSSPVDAPHAPAGQTVHLSLGAVALDGDLNVPAQAVGLVLFAHGSGSSRKSPRNRYVADKFNRRRFATLLFDLLSEDEDHDRAARFNIALLSERLHQAWAWTRQDARVASLPLGLFGASTGAAAALNVAAVASAGVEAVVLRGGRPDLADARALKTVRAPTLLIVGGADVEVLELNQNARRQMQCRTELAVVPGATHLFEEPGALDDVCILATMWFEQYLARDNPAGRADAP